MKVPWLPKEKIIERAAKVISDYEAIIGQIIGPPIPVEDIIRRYLGVKLGFMDFEEKLGMKGVLGATYVKARLICVNEGLQRDKSEGRIIFTCAHEVGHWVLHRPFVSMAERSGVQNNAIICRTLNAREPIEWQADYFAACLLMPEKETKEAAKRAFGRDFLVLDNVKSSFGGRSYYVDPCIENWHQMAEMVCEAGGFSNVSKQAMSIRLQELGLLVNKTGARMDWSSHSSIDK
jgi:Zn-dependent peptidase ImmA (M78 family)